MKKEVQQMDKRLLTFLLIGALLILAFFTFNAYNNIQSAAVITSEDTCQFEKINQKIETAGLRGTHFWLPDNIQYSEVMIKSASAELTCNECSLSINGNNCYYQKGSVNKEVVDLGRCAAFMKEGKNSMGITSTARTSSDRVTQMLIEMEVKPVNC